MTPRDSSRTTKSQCRFGTGLSGAVFFYITSSQIDPKCSTILIEKGESLLLAALHWQGLILLEKLEQEVKNRMVETNAATLMDSAEQSAPDTQAENQTPPGVIKMPPWGIPTSETKDVLSTPDSTEKIVVTSNVIDIFGDDYAATQESEKELIEQDSVSQGVPVPEQDNIAQDIPAPEQDTTAQDDPAVDVDVFCQVVFLEKSVGFPFFYRGKFPSFSGYTMAE